MSLIPTTGGIKTLRDIVLQPSKPFMEFKKLCSSNAIVLLVPSAVKRMVDPSGYK